jgi:hypothetical protein
MLAHIHGDEAAPYQAACVAGTSQTALAYKRVDSDSIRMSRRRSRITVVTRCVMT